MENLLRYKDIIFYRILAGLKSEARKSYLGYVWFILEPALSTGVLYFAMSHLTGQRGAAAVFTILIGTLVWQWLEGSVMLTAGSILGKYHVHIQVPLPKYLFPLVDIGTNTVRFACAFAVMLVACFLLVPSPRPLALLWLPVLLGLQLALIVGLGLLVSLGVALLPDLRMALQAIFRMLFFISGIFFTAERVPAHLLPWFHANPVAVLIESYRAVILGGHAPDFPLLTHAALGAVGLIAAGALVQAWFDKRLLKLVNA